MSKLQLNFIRNFNIFNQGNKSESVVCGMASILFWPQCGNGNKHLDVFHYDMVQYGTISHTSLQWLRWQIVLNSQQLVYIVTVPHTELFIDIMTSKDTDILNEVAKFVYLEFKRRELCPGNDYTWKCLLTQYFGVLDSHGGEIRHDLSVSNISLAYIYVCIYFMQLLKLLCLFQFKWVTHWLSNSLGPTQGGRHFRTAFTGAFSWMNMYKFNRGFAGVCSWTSNWRLGAVQATDRGLSQWWLDYWRIYMRHSASVSKRSKLYKIL